MRYAAFLRGVTPMNAKMAEVTRAFESAGFSDVKTVLASGNVVFTADKASVLHLQAEAEAAMQRRLGRSFLTFVRPVSGLQALIESDPYKEFTVAAEAKRIVTFLREKPATLRLPIERDGARILALAGGAAFSAYVPRANDPAFMRLLDKTFGKAQTTRTWQTLERVVAAG